MEQYRKHIKKNRIIRLFGARLITKANDLELHIVVLSFNSQIFKHFLSLCRLQVKVRLFQPPFFRNKYVRIPG